MKVAATHLTPQAHAALMAESQRMRERAALRRQTLQYWERLLTDEQRHQRAVFEARMRANKVQRVTSSQLGDLT